MPSKRPDELIAGTAAPTDWLMFTPTGGPTYKCTVASIAGGVTSVNGYTGAVTISAGTGIGVSGSSGTITVSNSGVTSLNSLTGGLNIVAGSNITVTPSGSNITIAATGGGGGGGPYTINNQTGTTYTLQLSDAQQLVTFNNASGVTLYIPPVSSVNFPVGTSIDILRLGGDYLNRLTVVGTGAANVVGTPSTTLRDTWSGASLIHQSTNFWVIVGDLA
jgi:hypothetical protein